MYTLENDKKNRAYGLIATFLYVAIWVVLIYFISFRVNIPEEQGEGILINFGNTETGFGDEDLANTDEMADVSQPSQNSAEANADEHITQDIEDAPAVPSQTTPTTTPRPNQTNPRTDPVEQPPVEQPREVNQRALFPGRSNSNATSEGTAGGTGNQGNLAGDPAGSHAGTGTGNSGNSYNLSGRSLVGALPVPDYSVREEGRVIIEIRVDQQGAVVSTSFRSVGSTTTNSVLVAAAERAAKRAKFNVDETAPFPQVGTIVYNFKMR